MKQGNTRLARRLLWTAAVCDVLSLCVVSYSICWLSVVASGGSGGGAAGVVVFLLALLLFNAGVGLYAVEQGLLFELKIARVWRRVCIGVGFKSEAPSYKFGLMGAMRGDTKIITPRLREVHGSYASWSGTVTFFDGQTLSDYSKKSENFALAFGVPFITFEVAESGLIAVRAGKVPVPDAYDHPGRVQTSRAVNNRPLPQHASTKNRVSGEELLRVAKTLDIAEVFAYQEQSPKVTNVYARELELLKAVPMARDMNGRECKMPIEGQHWFIAARTGGGKGSWIWSLVLGLKPAWQLGLVKFWGCDPKRLELAIGRDWWEHYADNEEDIVKMLEHCVHEMFERAGKLQGKVRKFTPTQQTPLNVIVVDELGYLSAMLPDRKLRERAEKAVSTILALGRAVGYSLVGAVQDPRKETCGFRDLFPIRIAGGLPGAMVDLVLGEDMHDAGALCEQIPLTEPGVAYVISETRLKPICVRAAWCSDDNIQGMLSDVPTYGTVVDSSGAAAVKDENVSGKLDWNGQQLGQIHYTVE
jgi:hypothetical protein